MALLVLEGERRGVAPEAALVAALLSERDPTATPESRASAARTSSRSDLLTKLDTLRPGRSASYSALSRTKEALLDAVRRSTAGESDPHLSAPDSDGDREIALLHAIFTAWTDRLARRREPGSDRAVMVGGRGVRLARESAVREAELFVCVSLDDRSGPHSEALVRIASAVDREWLARRARLRSKRRLEFDEESERVSRTAHPLRRSDARSAGDPAPRFRPPHRSCSQKTAAARIAEVLPRDDPDWETLIARLRFLTRSCPDLALPAMDESTFTELLSSLSSRAKSFAELRRAPWREALLGMLSHAQRAALEREAPERLAVPSGSRIRVDYTDPARPLLAARIQELFGLAETPRLGRGRVPVLLHLLAPNGRPQQVTDDLASFWRTTYPEVRRELAARYPRHSWPLDATAAPAERRPRPRRT